MKRFVSLAAFVGGTALSLWASYSVALGFQEMAHDPKAGVIVFILIWSVSFSYTVVFVKHLIWGIQRKALEVEQEFQAAWEEQLKQKISEQNEKEDLWKNSSQY